MGSNVYQPAGNYYDKYHTGNPIARALMNGFLRAFDDLVRRISPVGNALEIGCGEGEMSMRLAKVGWVVQGCDIAADAVEEARRRVASAGMDISVEQHDIAGCGAAYPVQDLVVCCEVMEHLEDSHAALDVLTNLSRGHVLVSVPREPVWRMLNMARGRYWPALGNTPGHIQHWSSRRFIKLLDEHAEVVAVRKPFPWTMALCRVRSQ